MKTPMNLSLPRSLVTACLFAALSFVLHASARAADGTWTNLSGGDASGNWTNSANWSGGTVAGGSGFTANFNTLNITTDSTVTLGAPVTIGNLTFGDTTTNSAAGWVLGNGGDTNNTLTLAGTTPTITVNALGTGKSTVINAQILGTSGLTKTGSGRLVLNNASNSYTGSISNATMTVTNFGSPLFSTVVQQGRLVLGSATAAGTGNILVQQGSGTAFLDLNGMTVSNNVALNNDTYLYNSSTSTDAVLNGNLWLRGYGRIGSSPGDAAGTAVINGNIVFYAPGTSLYVGVGGSLTVLNGSANQGTIYVQDGTLRANDGVNYTTNSTLRLGNISTTHYGGILESSANITRSIGDGAGLISVGYSGTTNTNVGFSAYGAAITVALGGTSAPTPLVWGSANFLQGSSNMVLNAATANNTLTFANALDLNGGTRSITVAAQTAIMSGNISNSTGTAGLTKFGAGTLVLGGTNTYNGDTTISAGTLRGTVFSVPGNVVNNAAFILEEVNTNNFGGLISGTGTFEKIGTGTLTLTAANSFSGAATVSGGILRLGNDSALGTTSAGTAVVSGATLDLNARNIGGEAVTIAGTGVGGNGALVNNGTNTANGLRLALSGAANIGGTARIDTAFGGTIINGGANTLTKIGTNQFTINSGTTVMGTFNINQGSVVVVNSGSGLGDTNSGTFVASGASLGFYNNTGSAITTSENITLSGGAELSSSASINANTLSGVITLSNTTANVRVEPGVGMVLSGKVTGAGGLNKISSGVLTLSGSTANDFTGATTVTGGTLMLAKNAGVTAIAGALEVQSGAILQLSANGQVADSSAVTLSGGTIKRDSGVSEVFGDLNLTVASFLDYGSGATGTLQFGTYTPVSLLTVSNFLAGNKLIFASNLTGQITGNFAFDNSYSTSWDGSLFTVTAVPEPSAFAYLAVAGLAGMLVWFQRRRTSRHAQ